MNVMFNGSLFRKYLAPDGDGGGSGGEGGDKPEDDKPEGDQEDTEPKDEATIEFEAWLEKQPKEVQDQYKGLDAKGQEFFRNHSAGLRKALTSERNINKSAKAELKKLQDADSKRKKEAMSELDRTKTERQEALDQVTGLQAKLKTERIESAVLFEAAKIGFVTPQDAIKLVDQADFKYDEESGKVDGVAKALKALAESKPYLVGKKAGNGQGVGTNTGRQGRTPPEKIDKPPFVQPGTHL